MKITTYGSEYNNYYHDFDDLTLKWYLLQMFWLQEDTAREND